MKKKTVIVTGGAGFIGSHMVDFLIKKKFKVIVIDNLSGGNIKNIQQHLKKKKFLLLKKNICDNPIDIKNIKKADYIFHFAGKGDIVPSIQKPFQYFNTNVMGTINVLELARRLKVKKVVYAASSSCYGLAKTPTSEKNKINTLYPYALSKYMGENALFHWQKVYGVKVNSLRIFNAYGPRVSTKGTYGAVFGVFFKQKLLNLPFTLVGNGRQKRDFVYVTDVVEAFYLAFKSNYSAEVSNVGSGKTAKINDVAKLISSKKIHIPKRPGEPDITHADISKIKKYLKWSSKTSIQQGVKKILLEIDYWKKAPVWTPKKINHATKDWFKLLK